MTKMPALGNRLDIAAIRARYKLSDVISKFVPLKLKGREYIACCPFHDERTPSFGVNDDKGAFYCLGCGATGDVFDFLKHQAGLSLRQAAEWLGGDNLPHVTPEARQAKRTEISDEDAAKRADARNIWRTAQPNAGTLAETYARHRGIERLPPSVRFAVTPLWRDYKRDRIGPLRPAAICLSQGPDGRIAGIQRIFLNDDGTKASIDAPKRSLGVLMVGAHRLAPAGEHITVCEGPEDGWTLAMGGADVWVALGTNLMPHIQFPEIVRRVTIAGDNGAPGHAAAKAARLAYEARGLVVDVIYPPDPFKDWNEAHLRRLHVQP